MIKRMVNKEQFINHILSKQSFDITKDTVSAYAPSNIALIKYWGKRDIQLNLPVTSSLSVSLGSKGTTTRVRVSKKDEFILNDCLLNATDPIAKRAWGFINLIRKSGQYFSIETTNTIPTAAGLASSASGFAALVLALNELYQWNLDEKSLSLIARLGSGSAARSFWQGFVLWHKGELENGLDSYAESMHIDWPEFRIGLLIHDEKQKEHSSRDAMNITQETSPFYAQWPELVKSDLANIKQALDEKDFNRVGQIAESNAQAMHALMWSARPSICFSSAHTFTLIRKICDLRAQGIPVYFTQDAGPNVKLLFLANDQSILEKEFDTMHVINPFEGKEQ